MQTVNLTIVGAEKLQPELRDAWKKKYGNVDSAAITASARSHNMFVTMYEIMYSVLAMKKMTVGLVMNSIGGCPGALLDAVAVSINRQPVTRRPQSASVQGN